MKSRRAGVNLYLALVAIYGCLGIAGADLGVEQARNKPKPKS